MWHERNVQTWFNRFVSAILFEMAVDSHLLKQSIQKAAFSQGMHFITLDHFTQQYVYDSSYRPHLFRTEHDLQFLLVLNNRSLCILV